MIVLDASVAIAALTGHRPSGEVVAAQRLVAPHHIDVEVTHALRGLVRGAKLDVPEAARVLAAWQALAVDRVALPPLISRVWELRDNLTAYDAAYIAVAEHVEAPLVTADRRLATAPGARCQVQLVPLESARAGPAQADDAKG